MELRIIPRYIFYALFLAPGRLVLFFGYIFIILDSSPR